MSELEDREKASSQFHPHYDGLARMAVRDLENAIGAGKEGFRETIEYGTWFVPGMPPVECFRYIGKFKVFQQWHWTAHFIDPGQNMADRVKLIDNIRDRGVIYKRHIVRELDKTIIAAATGEKLTDAK